MHDKRVLFFMCPPSRCMAPNKNVSVTEIRNRSKLDYSSECRHGQVVPPCIHLTILLHVFASSEPCGRKTPFTSVFGHMANAHHEPRSNAKRGENGEWSDRRLLCHQHVVRFDLPDPAALPECQEECNDAKSRRNDRNADDRNREVTLHEAENVHEVRYVRLPAGSG